MEQKVVDPRQGISTVNEQNSSGISLNDAMVLWNKILEVLQDSVSKEGFSTWLAPTKALEYNNDTLTIVVPNVFFVEWIGQYYFSIIGEAAKRLTGSEIKIKFCTSDTKSQDFNITTSHRLLRIQPDVSKLQERYAFDTFVVGECNRFAYAACKAVAETPAETYNPLLIYGGVGLGKTHLLHSIGNHAKKLRPGLKVYYTPAENLFIELIQAIERGNTLEFKSKYRSQDILLIDDVHYLIGKERLQEEMFHIFNNLHNAGKQVAFTSDRPPHEIPTLEERLSSRLQAGLVVDLQPPDIETRIAILKKKAAKENIDLPQDVAYCIASRVSSNIRQLEGCLIRLMAISSIEGKTITVEQAEQALNAIIPKTDFITPEKIIEKIAQEFKFRPNELRSDSRTKNITLARQISMYLIRKMLNYSLKEIGTIFGGKDHTTVLHAYEKIELLRTQDVDINERISKIILGIRSA